jgi:hypothetical protein
MTANAGPGTVARPEAGGDRECIKRAPDTTNSGNAPAPAALPPLATDGRFTLLAWERTDPADASFARGIATLCGPCGKIFRVEVAWWVNPADQSREWHIEAGGTNERQAAVFAGERLVYAAFGKPPAEFSSALRFMSEEPPLSAEPSPEKGRNSAGNDEAPRVARLLDHQIGNFGPRMRPPGGESTI